MDTISCRIKQLRKHFRMNQAQLGALAGRSKAAVSQWERGLTEPDKASLHALKRKGRVNPDWITYGAEPMLFRATQPYPADLTPETSRVDAVESLSDLPQGGQYVLVSHYDVHLSAGDGCEWVEHPEEEPLIFRLQWFRSKGLEPEACRALRMRGDSMSPTLLDGDTVLIDTSSVDVRDDMIYAVLHHGELYIKRLFLLPGGALQLRSDNARYPTRDVSGQDLSFLIVLGRQVWRAG